MDAYECRIVRHYGEVLNYLRSSSRLLAITMTLITGVLSEMWWFSAISGAVFWTGVLASGAGFVVAGGMFAGYLWMKRRAYVARLLGDRHPDHVAFRGECGESLLWQAVEATGDVDVAAYLLEKGASVNFTDGRGVSVLHAAIVAGRQTAIYCLLERGAIVDEKASRLAAIFGMHLPAPAYP